MTKEGRWIEYKKKDQWVRACRVGDDTVGWNANRNHYRLVQKFENGEAK
jgi:hypothetical protein